MSSAPSDRTSRFAAGGAWQVLGSSPESVLEELFARDPGRRLRTMPGRETFHDEDRGWIVKRYTADEARDWWFERLRPGGPVSPARREARNLDRLHEAGFPVPKPHFYVAEQAARSKRGGRSAVVFEHVPHATDLRARLTADPRLAEVIAPRLGKLVADFHRGGWYHRDLYLHHFLLDEFDQPTLIDLSRARRERAPRLRWFVKDLAALLVWLPDEVRHTATRRFFEEWERASGVGPFTKPQRRRFLRAVEAKRRSLSSHEPKTPDSVAEPAG